MQAKENNQLALVPQNIQVSKPEPIIRNLDDIARVSKLLAESGFFSDAKSVAQCGVKVLAGYEMGFKAFQSMTGIHIINGKPSVGAGLMAARIRSSGRYDYEVLEQSDTVCKIAVFEVALKSDIFQIKRQFAKGSLDKERYQSSVEMLSLGVSTFTYDDAKKQGTKNLDKFPKNMLFARCISNAVKFYCPDVFDCSVYVPEELGADVDAQGEIVVQTIEPQYVAVQPAPTPAPNLSKESAMNILKDAIAAKGWELADVGAWLKSIICDKYNKPSSKECTPDEILDLAEWVKNFVEEESKPIEEISFE